MISVITPTIRSNGLEIVAKSLRKQTFEDFEWLIGSPFDPTPYLGENPIPHIWIEDNFKGGFWTLNRIYNKLFENTKGGLVITQQDNIYTPPTSLEAFWEDFEATHGTALISGVGDQYSDVDAFLRPINKCWTDPRKTTKYGTFYECLWNDSEWNLAAIPKKLFFAVGGMDEQLDFLGYGGDQLQVCDRLNDFGAQFYLNQSIESYTLRHTRDAHGGQEAWDKNHTLFNGTYYQRKEQLIKEQQWPIVLDFGRKDVLATNKGGD